MNVIVQWLNQPTTPSMAFWCLVTSVTSSLAIIIWLPRYLNRKH